MFNNIKLTNNIHIPKNKAIPPFWNNNLVFQNTEKLAYKEPNEHVSVCNEQLTSLNILHQQLKFKKQNG